MKRPKTVLAYKLTHADIDHIIKALRQRANDGRVYDHSREEAKQSLERVRRMRQWRTAENSRRPPALMITIDKWW